MGISYRFGWYLAVLQLFFALCWTIYVIYFPKLAAAAGVPAKAVTLMLDQATFTICDFATGVAADKVTRVLGCLGYQPCAAPLQAPSCFIWRPRA